MKSRPRKPFSVPKDESVYRDHVNVFVYQFGGYSERGLAPDGSPENFRCWNLEDIYSAEIIPAAGWHTGRTSWIGKESGCIDDPIA
jgi:hypothetical protein